VAGLSVSVVLNGTTYSIALDSALQDGFTSLVSCDSLDPFYINYIVLTCTDRQLSANIDACQESVTETVVASSVALSLTGGADTTPQDLEEALNTEESQDALLATLAESLGIDPARITIVGVTVTQVRRLLQQAAQQLRHLTATANNFNVELDYEVETDTSINDTAAIQESMVKIGEAQTNESTTFATALVVNLEVAANTTSNTSAGVLAAVVEVVKEQGITIEVVQAPTVVTRIITTTTTTTTGTGTTSIQAAASGGDSAGASSTLAIVIILIVVIIVVVGLAVGYWYARRNGLLPRKAGSGMINQDQGMREGAQEAQGRPGPPNTEGSVHQV